MPKFDLKGTSDDRSQRFEEGEYMDFDLLKVDKKFVPCDGDAGKLFKRQLMQDTRFLLQHHMPNGPVGLIAYDQLPEFYRGECGLMDYSMLLGVAPKGTPGGLVRLEVLEEVF